MRRSCLFRRSAVKVIFLASRGIMIPAQAHFFILDLDLDRTDCIPLINTGIYPVAHENIGYFHQTHPFKKTFPADTAFDMQQEPSGNMILSIKRSFKSHDLSIYVTAPIIPMSMAKSILPVPGSM